ncbi:MAG: phosphoribosylamine--glycine ligase, partial [Actinomycetota bacterium]|nr:phosphoribosylamine--glycine ligase [Actinomycetota bacterium]
QPVVDAMRHRGTPFVGLLYAGLALTARGTRVIEFNARFGDPETQVVLARLASPLGRVLMAAATGRLADLPPLAWRQQSAVTVVIAAHNYPETPRTGDLITGIAAANEVTGVNVLHAGTALNPQGQVVSAGGRVLSVTATGDSLGQARERAYAAIVLITLAGSHYRTDIAESAAADSA